MLDVPVDDLIDEEKMKKITKMNKNNNKTVKNSVI